MRSDGTLRAGAWDGILEEIILSRYFHLSQCNAKFLPFTSEARGVRQVLNHTSLK
jgi:hypothetical protein